MMISRYLNIIFFACALTSCATDKHKLSGQPPVDSSRASKISTTPGSPIMDDRKHLVAGDFNGDGYLDNAYASPYGEDGWNLVVYLDVLSDSGEIVVLEQHTPDVSIEDIRLETKPAGEYTTFCGLSPVDCEPDAAQRIIMPSDGIYLVVIEASGSLIYWDPALNMFVRHWLGD